MKKIIFRKPFITKESRDYGTLWYDKAQFWMNTSRFTEETDVKSYCIETADIYYDKARRALGFISVEDMNRYYEKYRRF